VLVYYCLHYAFLSTRVLATGQLLTAPIQSKNCFRRGFGEIRVGGAEMQGFRLTMEDAYNVVESLPDHPGTTFMGVYDGHAGEQCSAFLSENLPQLVNGLSDVFDEKQIVDVVKQADQNFLDSRESVQDKKHGSTCVFAVVRRKEEKTAAGRPQWDLLVANVGDSRVIIVRENGTLVSLTEDHKPNSYEEGKRIVAAGGHVAMNRVDGQLAMSRAMGDWQYKANPDLALEDQKVIPVADVTREVVQEGDMVVVMCDGIVEQMDNEMVCEIAHTHVQALDKLADVDPVDIVGELFDASLEHGSRDNHSAMVAVFGKTGKFGEGYSKEDEFVAGPFSPHNHDDKWVETYYKYARSFGVTDEQLEEKIAVADAAYHEAHGNLDVAEQQEEQGGGNPTIGDLTNLPGNTQKEQLRFLLDRFQQVTRAQQMQQDGMPGGEEEG
jgi:serine/threonine protein phosphatase PrpC